MEFKGIKELELVDILKCRKIKIACLQEVKYVGHKTRFINHEYKLFYMGTITNIIGEGIVVQ